VRFKKTYFQETYGLKKDSFDLFREVIEPGNEFSDLQNRKFTAPITFAQMPGLNEYQSRMLDRAFKYEKHRQDPIDAIDNAVDNFTDEELESFIEPKIRGILKAFAENKDPQEIEDALAALYPEDDSKELEEKIAKAIFMSELWGRAAAGVEPVSAADRQTSRAQHYDGDVRVSERNSTGAKDGKTR
jgi:hypothetical protein